MPDARRQATRKPITFDTGELTTAEDQLRLTWPETVFGVGREGV